MRVSIREAGVVPVWGMIRLLGLALVALFVSAQAPMAGSNGPRVAGGGGPRLGASGAIQHLIVIGFDNTHLEDIQQMPSLLAFLQGGTLLTNDHSVLKSHTQADFVSIAAGAYPSRTGVPDQSFLDNGHPVGFGYWLGSTAAGQPQVFSPPPWLAFTQRGIAVGGVGWGDMELESAAEVATENVPIEPFDSDPSDYLGVAVHQPDGTDVFGTPNLPDLYNAPRWDDPSQTLGAFPVKPVWSSADAWWPLAATVELQQEGVPVTFTYISDAHDARPQGGYADRLAAYDAAFKTFFAKLAAIGIDRSNTLFVLTSDEGDHFDPQGDRSTSLASWLADNSTYNADPANLAILSDAAPFVYLKDPGLQNATLDQTLAALKDVPGWEYIGDEVALSGLHISSLDDPGRNPSFVLYGNGDSFYSGRPGSKEISLDAGFLWNHGTVAPDINATWLALAGPGVQAGLTLDTWIDHTDVMPTIDLLLGFAPQPTDGRAVFEALSDSALPASAVAERQRLELLAEAFKQLNAPVGSFGLDILRQSTQAALAATTPQGRQLDAALSQEIAERDSLAGQMQAALTAALAGGALDDQAADSLIGQGQALLARAGG
jgi:hypothetical protein